MNHQALDDYLSKGGVIRVLPPTPNQKISTENVGHRLIAQLQKGAKRRDEIPMSCDDFELALRKLKKWGVKVNIENGWYSL